MTINFSARTEAGVSILKIVGDVEPSRALTEAVGQNINNLNGLVIDLSQARLDAHGPEAVVGIYGIASTNKVPLAVVAPEEKYTAKRLTDVVKQMQMVKVIPIFRTVGDAVLSLRSLQSFLPAANAGARPAAPHHA